MGVTGVEGIEQAAPSPRRQATREKLLDAATEVFAEAGLQGAAVEAICARAGFTRGAFYSNFETKEQLFLALLQREFERRTAHLEALAHVMEPLFRERSPRLDAAEAAGYIADFFAPEREATTWYMLETEFLLLAMRDPSLAADHHTFTEGFYLEISGVVERILAAAGRRFVLPAAHAVPILGEVYQRALRISALAGPAASGGLGEVGEHLAELLFAITEPV